MTAKTFNKTPSEMLGIENTYVAYCINEAGAFLINQEKVPNYKKREAIRKNGGLNRNREALLKIREFGASVKI